MIAYFNSLRRLDEYEDLIEATNEMKEKNRLAKHSNN
jgi:hypothetical protein